MIQYSLYLTKTQLNKLRKLQASNGLNVSEHIRAAINKYLEEIERNKTSTSPKGKDYETIS